VLQNTRLERLARDNNWPGTNTLAYFASISAQEREREREREREILVCLTLIKIFILVNCFRVRPVILLDKYQLTTIKASIVGYKYFIVSAHALPSTGNPY